MIARPVVDPRKASDLDEAARNPDGTYNGARALSWLSAVLAAAHGSKFPGFTEQEVLDEWAKAKARRQADKGVFG